MTKKQPQPTKMAPEYEIRVKAMTLATQHSRNCQTSTLIKLADSIYLFLTGQKQVIKE